MAGAEAELLDVTLPPFSLNVQLVKDGEPLKNIEVEIVQSNQEANRYMNKDVDENGIASFRLTRWGISSGRILSRRQILLFK